MSKKLLTLLKKLKSGFYIKDYSYDEGTDTLTYTTTSDKNYLTNIFLSGDKKKYNCFKVRSMKRANKGWSIKVELNPIEECKATTLIEILLSYNYYYFDVLQEPYRVGSAIGVINVVVVPLIVESKMVEIIKDAWKFGIEPEFYRINNNTKLKISFK